MLHAASHGRIVRPAVDRSIASHFGPARRRRRDAGSRFHRARRFGERDRMWWDRMPPKLRVDPVDRRCFARSGKRGTAAQCRPAASRVDVRPLSPRCRWCVERGARSGKSRYPAWASPRGFASQPGLSPCAVVQDLVASMVGHFLPRTCFVARTQARHAVAGSCVERTDFSARRSDCHAQCALVSVTTSTVRCDSSLKRRRSA